MSPKLPRSSSTADMSEPVGEGLSPWACISCATRKVKCDRCSPCSNCVKNGTICEYRAPGPPQRKKRKAEREALNRMVDRMKEYEDRMRELGMSFEPFDMSSLPATFPIQEPRSLSVEQSQEDEPGPSGEFLIERGRGQRYAEQGGLPILSRSHSYSRVGPSPLPHYAPFAYDDAKIAAVPTSILLAPLSGPGEAWNQPPPISALWSIFCNNVHPLTHIVHLPSLEKDVSEYTTAQYSQSPVAESLMLSLCACTLLSMDDIQCHSLLRRPRIDALAALQVASRDTLIRSGFLFAPTVTSLQALAFYITSLQSLQHANTTALLTKIAIQSARSINLHRDGTQLGLSVFDTEMRRRLWWYLLSLDAQASELQGMPELATLPRSDAVLPLNVDDYELAPDMQQLPSPRTGASEMLFCYLRYAMIKMSSPQRIAFHQRHREGMHTPGQPFSADIERISQLENRIQESYLAFCNPDDPSHTLATTSTRAAICKMRLQATSMQNGRSETQEAPRSPSVGRAFFADCLRMIGYDNLIHADTSSTGLIWQVRHEFPWAALLNVLEALSSIELNSICGNLDNLIKAWQMLDKMHAHHPEFLRDALPGAHQQQQRMMELTSRAWANCYTSLPAKAAQQPPDFVQTLEARRHAYAPGVSPPLPGAPSQEVTIDPAWQSVSASMDPSAMGYASVAPYPFPFSQPSYQPRDPTTDTTMLEMSSAFNLTPPKWELPPSNDPQLPTMFRFEQSPGGQGWS